MKLTNVIALSLVVLATMAYADAMFAEADSLYCGKSGERGAGACNFGAGAKCCSTPNPDKEGEAWWVGCCPSGYACDVQMREQSGQKVPVAMCKKSSEESGAVVNVSDEESSEDAEPAEESGAAEEAAEDAAEDAEEEEEESGAEEDDPSSEDESSEEPVPKFRQNIIIVKNINVLTKSTKPAPVEEQSDESEESSEGDESDEGSEEEGSEDEESS